MDSFDTSNLLDALPVGEPSEMPPSYETSADENPLNVFLIQSLIASINKPRPDVADITEIMRQFHETDSFKGLRVRFMRMLLSLQKDEAALMDKVLANHKHLTNLCTLSTIRDDFNSSFNDVFALLRKLVSDTRIVEVAQNEHYKSSERYKDACIGVSNAKKNNSMLLKLTRFASSSTSGDPVSKALTEMEEARQQNATKSTCLEDLSDQIVKEANNRKKHMAQAHYLAALSKCGSVALSAVNSRSDLSSEIQELQSRAKNLNEIFRNLVLLYTYLNLGHHRANYNITRQTVAQPMGDKKRSEPVSEPVIKIDNFKKFNDAPLYADPQWPVPIAAPGKDGRLAEFSITRGPNKLCAFGATDVRVYEIQFPKNPEIMPVVLQERQHIIMINGDNKLQFHIRAAGEVVIDEKKTALHFPDANPDFIQPSEASNRGFQFLIKDEATDLVGLMPIM